MDKAQARVEPGDFTLTRYQHDDVLVRVYGDTAVATGCITTDGTFRGKPNTGQVRFTRVFVKRDGRWQLVANQLTRVPQANAEF